MKQISELFEDHFNTGDKLTILEASEWATNFAGYEVSPSNIQYLIKYNRINSTKANGISTVQTEDLRAYFCSKNLVREANYKAKLGQDLNWHLSFDQFKESETTKHVHRLHPYKGKFIPQLVEYFLDSNTDEYKNQTHFIPGDIVLDPFCGSGTTLVQANELGIHGIGVDISEFNTLISNTKLINVNLTHLEIELRKVFDSMVQSPVGIKAREFEANYSEFLKDFNSKYFPAPEFRAKVKNNIIDEQEYATEKEKEAVDCYRKMMRSHKIDYMVKDKKEEFLDYWYAPSILDEIRRALERIQNCSDSEIVTILRIIVSRTARSCRATTHYNLATLIKPVTQPYYCSKHSKICRPLLSSLKWWRRYSADTVKRLNEFSRIRTDTAQICFTGDSRSIDLPCSLRSECHTLYEIYKQKKIKGIFSSPPYVGLIDYHDQHAYAYELFGLQRNDESEIGPLFRGKGKTAQSTYIEGIADVLNHCRQYLIDDFDVFLVANDKFQLYSAIAERANMKIVKEFRRPVLNRAEGNIGVYAESIFHLKGNN